MPHKTNAPLVSEAIEGTMGYIIGNLWAQSEELKTQKPEDYKSALKRLYMAAKQIDRLSIVCNATVIEPRPVHFSIAASNELLKISNYIESEIGFNPLFDKNSELYQQWNPWG